MLRPLKPAHLILLLVLNCGWAAVPIFAGRLKGALSPTEFVFLRYAFAFVGLAACWPWLPGKVPRGRDFWRTVLMGVLVFNLGHFFQVAGIQRSSASDTSILLVLDPLVSSLGATLFLHELIPVRRWFGFALAIGGVVAMSLWRPAAPLPGLFANLLIVLSFVTEAVWSVMGKPLITRWGIPKVTLLALGAGTVANLAWLAPDPATHWDAIARLGAEGWWVTAISGIALTAFGYCIWYVVIRETPVSVAAMTIYLQPIIASGLAVALTHERFHLGHGLGALAILSGLVLGLKGTGTGKTSDA